MASEYNQICPVLFGENAIYELGNKVKEWNIKKALCVYDAGVKACGIADKVRGILSDGTITIDVFEGVQPDTPDYVINQAAEIYYGKGYDLVIGLGGGSSMDTAKALTVMIEYPGPISEYYAEKVGMNKNKNIKLILIPTASGTGSEMTPISVVFDSKENIKATVLKAGDLAIVDPVLTVSSPPAVTSSSGLDAFSHALEAYTSNRANFRTDLLALEAMRLIFFNIEKAYSDGSNIEARTALSFASNIAGTAFADASVHVGHSAAHELGSKFHLPHGALCALTIPAIIEFEAEYAGKKIEKLAETFDISVPSGASPKETGKIVADQLRSLCRKVGIKSLKDFGITYEDAMDCAAGAIAHNWFSVCSLRPVGIQEMREILENIYNNY